MTTHKLYPIALSSNELDIDHNLGIIKGVCVISAGTTQPSGGGHGPFEIDLATLDQVVTAINAKRSGIKCRITHPEVEGDADDLPHRIGFISKARRSGDSVLADFTAYDPDNGHVKNLLAIAATDPSSCGMSIVSRAATFSDTGALRVPSLDAVDFVGEPAACPAGLLAASSSSSSTGNQNMITANPVLNRQDVQDAILIRTGTPLARFDGQGRVQLDAFHRSQLRTPSRTALELSGERLADIGEHYLRSVGPATLKRDLPKMSPAAAVNLSMDRLALSRYFPSIQPSAKLSPSMVSLASTGDYPSLLADTLNRATLTHYAAARRSWRAWAKPGVADDFKQAERPRLDDLPGLVEVEPGSTIEYSAPSENASETFALGTFARGLKFSRRSMLNDDTGTLADIASALGLAAARLEDRLAYAVLTDNAATADGNSLFSTGHGNITTGALTHENVDTAAAILAKTTNGNGDLLDIQPGVLIVPSELKGTGEDLLDSRSGASRHESESRLRLVSTGHLSADSDTQWYLGTDPSRMSAVEVSFLRGNEQPHIDSTVDFDSDGMKFKVRHDVQAAAIDPRLMIRSTGS